MAKLVAGPGVYICNECIDLCTQIVAMETMPVVGASHERPDDELLTSLARVQKVAPRMDSAIVTQITPMSASGDRDVSPSKEMYAGYGLRKLGCFQLLHGVHLRV